MFCLLLRPSTHNAINQCKQKGELSVTLLHQPLFDHHSAVFKLERLPREGNHARGFTASNVGDQHMPVPAVRLGFIQPTSLGNLVNPRTAKGGDLFFGEGELEDLFFGGQLLVWTPRPNMPFALDPMASWRLPFVAY